ncbi:MAG: HD domain-containing protein [Acidobacteriota bacterium]
MQLRLDDPELRETLDVLCREVRDAGGRALAVGGSVRDALLGLPIVDLDLEVFGLDAEALRRVLERRFRLDLVGESFGVLKLRGLPIDVSLPRRESKQGRGHRGFAVHADPHLSFAEAATRRDFTMNAMGADPLSGELLDPHGGRGDLEAGRLRHVSAKFAEDPLRVLRGMQMAARFRLEPTPETVALCRTIEPEGLAHERIFDEWRKLLVRGVEISRGLRFLRDTGWVRYTPELEALIHCPQDPTWHPEGDVWDHTLHVLDAFAARRLGDEREDLIVGLACVCHDLGKPPTTRFEDGRWRSKGHEEAGEEPTRRFLGRMTDEKKLIEAVVPLVREHLKPMMLWKAKAGAAAIRRLARRVGRIDRLVRLARADHAGRPPLPTETPATGWLLARAEELRLEADAPAPLVLGRHLIELGYRPGPRFGPVLDALFEQQLDGAFGDEAAGIDAARVLLDGLPVDRRPARRAAVAADRSSD